MTRILLGIALVAAAAVTARADDKAAGPDVEGKWLIVYVEEGGKRNATWEQKVATVKGDTLSYSKEGDDRSLRLSFGENQTVKVSGVGAKEGGKGAGEMSGVYVLGQDYLCLSLNPAGAKGNPAPKATGKKSSGAFILILRRQR
jgi:hypothetical protein